MKRLIKIFSWTTPPAITILVMIMLMVTVSAKAKVGDTFTQNHLKYRVLTEDTDTGTVSVEGTDIGYSYTEKHNLDLFPKYVSNNGIKYTLTEIRYSAFEGRSDLTGTIVIPNTVKTIGGRAFFNCSGLTGELVIPNSVTKIDYYAFYGCKGLSGSLNIPTSITYLGAGAFSDCTGFSGNLVIPNSLTKIEDGTFEGCTGLTGDLVIPSSIKRYGLGHFAFEKCNFQGTLRVASPEVGFLINGSDLHFSKVILENTVKKILGGVSVGYLLSNCPDVESIFIPNSVDSIETLGYDVKKLTNLEIPASVKYFNGQRMLIGQNNLESLTVKSKYIYNGSCNGWTKLKNLILENTKVIGQAAFMSCTGLTNVVIPNSVDSIGPKAFFQCTGLTDIKLPDSITTIPEAMLNGDTALTKINIPNTVTTIGLYAFNNCKNLKEITLPSSVTNIIGPAFPGCTGLTKVSIQGAVENVVGANFQGCNNIKTLNINAKKISNGAFNGCANLEEVNFGDSVKEIGEGAFGGCTKLKKIVFPSSLTTISGKSGAFYGCTTLTDVTIPNSVTKMEGRLFSDYSSHIVLPSNLTVSNGFFEKAPDITIPYSACNDNLNSIGNSPVYYMGTDLSARNLKNSTISGHTYVKPSVYAQFKNDATYKNLHLTDSIPVTFPEGQEYITLCRDFDVDLRHANDHLPLNVKPLKAYIVRDADMDKGTAYLDELTYIPSRLKANVEGYKGVDEYVGVVLSGTPGYTYYVQMGEDDYGKGIDGQMTVEKALSLDKSSAYNYDVNLVESASAPRPTLVGAAGQMTVEPTETIDGVTYKNYGLKDGKFVEYEAEGVIPYNHAYLHVPVSSASGAKKSFAMEVRSSSPTTGIREADASADSDSAQKAAYNLMGMRVGSGYHGIVIVDGKKFIRK